jgi:hypothetical protein
LCRDVSVTNNTVLFLISLLYIFGVCVYVTCGINVGFEEYVQGVDKIMETLRYCGIEFVLATLKEHRSATLNVLQIICTVVLVSDCLCGLVVRVSGYRSRGLGFDSRPYQIF